MFQPGSLDPTTPIGDELAALAICADTAHASHAEAAAKRGAKLYLAGVFFTPEGYADSADRLAGYAAMHSMAVVMSNAAGGATGFESAGGSSVWSESGALVVRLEHAGAGLAVATRSGSTWTGIQIRCDSS